MGIWPDGLHVRDVLLRGERRGATTMVCSTHRTDRICKGSMQQRSLSFGSDPVLLLFSVVVLGSPITPPAAARPRESGGRSTRDNTSISFCKAQANMPTCICDLTISTSLIAHRRHRIWSTDHRGRSDPAPARDLLVFTNACVWFEELKEVELG